MQEDLITGKLSVIDYVLSLREVSRGCQYVDFCFKTNKILDDANGQNANGQMGKCLTLQRRATIFSSIHALLISIFIYIFLFLHYVILLHLR